MLYAVLYVQGWFLTRVPTMRYVATCGADMFERTYVNGPYNEQFLDSLEEAMAQDDFIYTRRNGEIYIPYFGLSGPVYNGYLLFEGYEDFSLNIDWKIVSEIAEGVVSDSGMPPPPKVLAELIAATEAKYGPFPRRNTAGERIYGPDSRFHDSEDACAFMRAAILKETDGRGRP